MLFVPYFCTYRNKVTGCLVGWSKCYFTKFCRDQTRNPPTHVSIHKSTSPSCQVCFRNIQIQETCSNFQTGLISVFCFGMYCWQTYETVGQELGLFSYCMNKLDVWGNRRRAWIVINMAWTDSCLCLHSTLNRNIQHWHAQVIQNERKLNFSGFTLA